MTTLKTAEEYARDTQNALGDGVSLTQEYRLLETQFKDCQSNAIAHGRELGLREAAEIVRKAKEDAFSGTVHMNEYGMGCKAGMNSAHTTILSAIVTKKEGE